MKVTCATCKLQYERNRLTRHVASRGHQKQVWMIKNPCKNTKLFTSFWQARKAAAGASKTKKKCIYCHKILDSNTNTDVARHHQTSACKFGLKRVYHGNLKKTETQQKQIVPQRYGKKHKSKQQNASTVNPNVSLAHNITQDMFVHNLVYSLQTPTTLAILLGSHKKSSLQIKYFFELLNTLHSNALDGEENIQSPTFIERIHKLEREHELFLCIVCLDAMHACCLHGAVAHAGMLAHTKSQFPMENLSKSKKYYYVRGHAYVSYSNTAVNSQEQNLLDRRSPKWLELCHFHCLKFNNSYTCNDRQQQWNVSTQKKFGLSYFKFTKYVQIQIEGGSHSVSNTSLTGVVSALDNDGNANVQIQIPHSSTFIEVSVEHQTLTKVSSTSVVVSDEPIKVKDYVNVLWTMGFLDRCVLHNTGAGSTVAAKHVTKNAWGNISLNVNGRRTLMCPNSFTNVVNITDCLQVFFRNGKYNVFVLLQLFFFFF